MTIVSYDNNYLIDTNVLRIMQNPDGSYAVFANTVELGSTQVSASFENRQDAQNLLLRYHDTGDAKAFI